MKVKITKLKPLKIYHAHFDDQIDLTTSLLRPQEFYESLEFRLRWFGWAEYVEWYVRKFNKPFDSLTDIGGANIPGDYIKSWYDQAYCKEDLSEKEEEFFNKFLAKFKLAWIPSKFYLIATCGNIRNLQGYMAHELSHAYFYLISEYRDAILKVVRRCKAKGFRKKLKDFGYCDEVIEDEIHAYGLTGYDPFYTMSIRKLPKELQELRRDLKKVRLEFIKQGVLPC